MGATIAQKILAAHSGRDHVEPGEIVFARLDLVMGTDPTVPLSIKVFREMGATKVFDPDKIALVNDHFVPAKDIASAELSREMRQFAREYGITHYFEVGRSGVCHTVVPEAGLVVPGDLVVGADSHTCTYGALGALATGVGSTDMAASWALGETWFRVPETLRFEFRGSRAPWVGAKDMVLAAIGEIGVEGARYMAVEFEGAPIRALNMAERFTMSNMAIECGAKTGLIAADDVTLEYVKGRAKREPVVYTSDPDAEVARTVGIDLEGLEPLVAKPSLPSNVVPVREVGSVAIDQVVIGSCTNGRIEDMREAAGVLRGRKVADTVRCIVIPSSPEVYMASMKEGLVEAFMEAGCVVSAPTCGPCIGGYMGVLAAGEKCVSTTNRNFVGRMGDPTSEVYLANPAVAAASAVTGTISHPADVVGETATAAAGGAA